MIRGSSIFHIVEVKYESGNELSVRKEIWDVLKDQAQGYWFEHQGEDSLERVHRHFPDIHAGSVPTLIIRSYWVSHFCFRDHEDAQLLLTYLRIMEDSE